MRWNSRQAWLARLGYSFFIIAAVLAWEIYRALTGRAGPVPKWQLALYILAGGMAVAMGIAGMRARHRLNRDGDDTPDPRD
jgi:4-amino-4-deoxy-L-arabinose transferase-like glycosyltransferase